MWDDGDALVVRANGVEARIPFSNISFLSCNYRNPPRIMLQLREACALGKEIAFIAPRETGAWR
ncbi:MAG TPA: hypothetical protein VG733_02865 [Chthoniobacteraceae bacterium]|nr:hypothetical protein [Chthoniobacteraceae bacterium]